MYLEPSTTQDNQKARIAPEADSPDGPGYWNSLIDERAAAAYLGLTARFMQTARQRGDGPQFIRISSRCIRYTRSLLKTYADARVRESTSDAGPAAA